MPVSVSQLNFDGKTKTQLAIERLKEYEPTDGYWLAFSGGKDSIVLYDLAVKSSVKFSAHYNLTTVDPPELVHFIKDKYPNVIIEKPLQTMWQLVEKNGLPYRRMRFCCRVLKESHGTGAVLTGVRHEESPRRAKRCVFEYHHDKKRSDIWFINPIIDWLETEVWSYIKSNHIPYCELYDIGWKRIGCVLCPFTTQAEKDTHAARYPKIVESYRRAYYRYFAVKGVSKHGDSKETIFANWLNEQPRIEKTQGTLFS